jgi:hypothetical protein
MTFLSDGIVGTEVMFDNSLICDFTGLMIVILSHLL